MKRWWQSAFRQQLAVFLALLGSGILDSRRSSPIQIGPIKKSEIS
jgi:hypothetical protein